MRPLRLKDYIGETYLEDVSLCDEVIRFFEGCDRYRVTGTDESIANHKEEGGDILVREKNKTRKCKDLTLWLPDLEQESHKFLIPLFENICQVRDKYAVRTGTRLLKTVIVEGINIQKYVPPLDCYSGLHFEQSTEVEIFARRMYVFMVYLNDVQKAGETFFPGQKRKVKPRRGKLLIWPAHYTHPHKGIPTPETKYILTGWFTALYGRETEGELNAAIHHYHVMHTPRGYFDRPSSDGSPIPTIL
tara:strand:- start:15941 stop:16678 length:738 start_codon:yes stop_codon:yes gene_type:complete